MSGGGCTHGVRTRLSSRHCCMFDFTVCFLYVAGGGWSVGAREAVGAVGTFGSGWTERSRWSLIGSACSGPVGCDWPGAPTEEGVGGRISPFCLAFCLCSFSPPALLLYNFRAHFLRNIHRINPGRERTVAFPSSRCRPTTTPTASARLRHEA